jgi:hypothetical protein
MEMDLYTQYDIASAKLKKISKAYCCLTKTTSLTATPSATSGTSVTITIACGDSSMIVAAVITSAVISNINDLVDALNNNLGKIATFTTDGTDITGEFKQFVFYGVNECDDLTLAIQVNA